MRPYTKFAPFAASKSSLERLGLLGGRQQLQVLPAFLVERSGPNPVNTCLFVSVTVTSAFAVDSATAPSVFPVPSNPQIRRASRAPTRRDQCGGLSTTGARPLSHRRRPLSHRRRPLSHRRPLCRLLQDPQYRPYLHQHQGSRCHRRPRLPRHQHRYRYRYRQRYRCHRYRASRSPCHRYRLLVRWSSRNRRR